jgi:hypothetical protein
MDTVVMKEALKSKTGWIRSGFGTSIGFNGLANGYVDVLGTPKASEIKLLIGYNN